MEVSVNDSMCQEFDITILENNKHYTMQEMVNNLKIYKTSTDIDLHHKLRTEFSVFETNCDR